MEVDRTFLCIDAVDSFQINLLLGKRKTHSRVTQEQEGYVLVLHRRRRQIIGGVSLCHPDNVAEAQSIAIPFPLVEHLHQGLAQFRVVGTRGGTTSRKQSHSATIRVQEHQLTRRHQQRVVVLGELAGGRKHEGYQS